MNKSGNEYMSLPIDESGLIPLNEVGIGRWKEDPNYNIVRISNSNRSYNPNIGNKVSSYDDIEGISNIAEMSQEELQDAMYETQTGLEMVGNALLGMAAIAGTTYVANTVGTANMLFEMSWDNATNNYMAELEEQARRANPIYRPTDYDKWSLGQRLGNSVFWADLIQNLGFTIGAGAAAATWTAIGTAIPGVGPAMAAAPKIVQAAVPSLMSSMGEAAVEAIHHKNEQIQRKEAEIQKQYQTALSLLQNPVDQQQLASDYAEAISMIEDDERRAGNFVFGANTALLTLSNTIQFGDIFARGFSTGARIANTATRTATTTGIEQGITQFGKASIGGAVLRGTGKGLISSVSEGVEEGSQLIFTKAAAKNKDFNTFDSARFSLNEREQVSGIMQSMQAAFAESLHDPNAATEAAMGFFTGAIGLPRLKKYGIPKLEGGIYGSIKEELAQTRDFNRVIDVINDRLSDDKKLNDYYEGLVRHLVYQNAEDDALDRGDHRAFSDANAAKFLSDIIMFDKVGRLDVLQQIIDTAGNLTDEEIQSLIEETTKEDGQGVFVQNGNPASIQEARDILKKKTDSLKAKVDAYRQIKDDLASNYGELSENSLAEGLYYKMQEFDIDSRLNQMGDEMFDLVSGISKQEETLTEEDGIGVTQALAGITRRGILAHVAKPSSELAKKIQEAFQSPTYRIAKDTKDKFNSLISDYQAHQSTLAQYTQDFDTLISDPVKANQKNQDRQTSIAKKDDARRKKRQQKSKVQAIADQSTGDIASEILDGSFDIDDAYSALDAVEGSGDSVTRLKLKEATDIADAVRNQVGTASVQGAIDKVEDATDAQKNDAKAFMMYAGRNVGSRKDLLDTYTFTQMTVEQVAEALGIDPSAFDGKDFEQIEAELEDRKNAALVVLGESIEKGIADIEEAEGMSADISIPEDAPVVGRDSITPVQSVANSPSRFPAGTKIHNVDIGGMTIEEALDALPISRRLEESTKDGITTLEIVDYQGDRRISKPQGAPIDLSSIDESSLPKEFDGTARVVTLRKDTSGNVAGDVTFIPNDGSPFTGSVKFKNKNVYDSIVQTNGHEQEYINSYRLYLEKKFTKGNKKSQRSEQEVSPSSNTTSESSTAKDWTPGFEYFYRGEDPKYKGLTSIQVLEKRIRAFEDQSSALNEEEKAKLQELEYELAVRKYMKDNNVNSVNRQAMVQVGTKLNFMVKPEFPNTVFITVLDEAGHHAIVGVLRPTHAEDVLRRYRTKGDKSTTYIESNVTKATKKAIGTYDTWQQQNPLSVISPQGFTLAIDLSSEGDTYADIRTLADSRKEGKTESEKNIRPPKKSKAGNSYVLVKTSLKGEGEYITGGIASSIFNQSDTTAPVQFLKKIQNASKLSLQDKLNLIQEILDVDVLSEAISMSLESGKTESYIVRSKGKGSNDTRTTYGKISGDPNSIIQQLFDLVSGKVPYTVSRKYINSTIAGEDYNRMMAPVLTTNLTSLETVGDFFYMSPVAQDGTMIVGRNISEIKPSASRANKSASDVTILANEVRILKGSTEFIVNTTYWTVDQITEKGERAYLDRSANLSTVDPILATAFLSKNGIYRGMHKTPWGIYHIEKGAFVDIQDSMYPTIGAILDGAHGENARTRIQAILQHESIRHLVNNAELDEYINGIRKALSKTYNFLSSQEVVDAWVNERGQGPTVEVSMYVEDPSMPVGKTSVKDIIQTAIFDKQGNLLQPAKVVVVTHKIQAEQIQETGKDEQSEDSKQIISHIDNLGFSDVYNVLSPSTKQEFVNYLLRQKTKAVQTRVINKILAEAKTKRNNEIDAFVKSKIGQSKGKPRIATAATYRAINVEKEAAWLSRILPQVSSEDRIKLVKGILRIAKNDSSEMVWGMFKDGIIYVSENAAEGTVYHEAFHLVFDTLLSTSEVTKIYAEAKQKYGTDNLLELEELLAEDFRRYVSYNVSEQHGWLKTIWERIKNLIKYLANNMTYIDRVYYNISQGVYRNRKMMEFNEARYRKLTTDEVLDSLDPVTITRIRKATTVNKELTQKAKAVIANKTVNTLYLYSDLVKMFKHIPNYEEVVFFKEVKGHYKPVFYADMVTRDTLSELDEFDEFLSTEENRVPLSTLIAEYLNEKALLEEEIYKYTEEERNSENSTYEEESFANRERITEERASFDALPSDVREKIIAGGHTQEEYEAHSIAEKMALLHCLGI